MGKRKAIEVIVNKPEEEKLERLIVESIVKFTMCRINELPPRQRLPTFEGIIEQIKEKEEREL